MCPSGDKIGRGGGGTGAVLATGLETPDDIKPTWVQPASLIHIVTWSDSIHDATKLKPLTIQTPTTKLTTKELNSIPKPTPRNRRARLRADRSTRRRCHHGGSQRRWHQRVHQRTWHWRGARSCKHGCQIARLGRWSFWTSLARVEPGVRPSHIASDGLQSLISENKSKAVGHLGLEDFSSDRILDPAVRGHHPLSELFVGSHTSAG